MKLRLKDWKRCCRKGGGLWLGFKLNFPASIWDGDENEFRERKATNTTYSLIYGTTGLLFWTFTFEIQYNTKPISKPN